MIYVQLYFYEELFKVSAVSLGAHLLHTKLSGFQQKAAYPQHFTIARACPGVA